MLVHESVEGRRSHSIAGLGVLERAGSPALTGIARVASYVTGAAGAAVHILDEVHQRRIAADNAPLGEHPREDSMCRLVVDSEQRIVCADASADPRFSYSSFVQGDHPVRFYASVPLRTSDGVVVGTLCAFDIVAHELSDRQVSLLTDLAEQVISHLELTRIALDLGHVASHDALTGAVTRLVLADRLSQAFARRLRYGGETFLAVVDIDDFKLISDSYGNAAGDEVLVETANRLRLALRAEDTVARTGGDEFVILAEISADTHVEKSLLRRIEDALAKPVHCAGEDRPVAVSVGSTFVETGEDIRAALRRAERVMSQRSEDPGSQSPHPAGSDSPQPAASAA
jgi:diguanylate cyclase (GGDEF)-like protein